MQWKSVPGFRGYKASNTGLIRSPTNHILRQRQDAKGYLRVTIKCCSVEVHVIVCKAFHGLPSFEKPWALHRDDTKTHNDESNLYWGTPKENTADKLRNNPPKPWKVPICTREKIRQTYAQGGTTHKKLAKSFSLSRTTILRVLKEELSS